MKKNISMIVAGVILIGIGVFMYINRAQPENLNVIPNSAECVASTDCILPMEYAVQSNCPYQAVCYEGSCMVFCPMWEHSPNPEQSISYQVSCTESAKCDCSGWDSENKYPCECINGQCGSVVDEIAPQES